MMKPVNKGSIPNISALAWELVERFPDGAHVFCLQQDFAEELKEELSYFSTRKSYLLVPHDIDSHTQRRASLYERKERLSFINALSLKEKAYFIWTASSLMERALPHLISTWKKERLSVTRQVGRDYKRAELNQLLIDFGYDEAEIVEIPGQFAVRGSIVDFFSFLEPLPIRVDLSDDKVESLHSFDPQTQLREALLEEIEICPAREFLVEDFGEFKNLLRTYLSDKEYPLELKEAALALLSSGSLPPGFELWSFLTAKTQGEAHLQGKAHLHSEAVPAGGEVATPLPSVVIEPSDFFSKWRPIEQHIEKKLSLALSLGDLAPKFENYLFSHEELARKWSALKDAPSLSYSQQNGENAAPALSQIAETATLSAEWRSHNLEAFAKKIILESSTSSVVFTFHSLSQLERLQFLLSPYGLSFDKKIESLPPVAVGFHVFLGSLKRSFSVPSKKLLIFSESDLLGSPRNKNRKNYISKTSKEIFFRDIREGDLVVHAVHGVGQYLGLKTLSIQGTNSDLIELLYKDGKVYVPVQQLRRLHRFGGEEASDASLDKLGGATWKNKKERVKKEIQAFAGELLTLYTQRTLAQGIIIRPPEADIQAFAASFPFDETIDQEKAIDAILNDLSSGQPMDRLLCGDVGYGKTEVALRAAHAVAAAGYQVAVLSPTTLLTAQHEKLFKTRLGEFSFKSAGLSRFNSEKESRKVIEDLRSGELSVVVGTHKLLGSSVAFKNLGLIIIDEEQRFGVIHKEKLKKLRTNVHVLSMTATPIPRTLSMAMSGIRQFSVMTTPPQDRLSVKTVVTRKNSDVIKEAIEFETRRGGQVFYLFNRVRGIEKAYEDIIKLLPTLRVDYAHGQMDEEKLEEKMLKFYRGETQVLVTTTIIEAGLDVSNANTLIVENAERFGLSQLYQLRGRVGRSDRRAYAYLMLPESGAVSKVAEERLGILELYQDLGSGFTIASHDLDLRGAGEVLGDSQSGHMSLVGSETYFELLQESIAELKGEALERDFEPEIQLGLNTSIPDTYIKEATNRLSFYRKLSSASNEESVDQILHEMIDRFGEAPPSVSTLMRVMKVVCVLRRLRIRSLSTGKPGTTIVFDPSSTLPRHKLVELITKYPKHFQLLPEGKLLIKNPTKDTPSEDELLKRVDSTLSQFENLSH